jgi:hypothetical protein
VPGIFSGGDWRLGLLFSLKTVVAGPECSKQAETRLASFHTIFRNARLSTSPVSEEAKRRSRQDAVRHGLTAETVIDALENAEDYAAFEMAVTADYDAQSAVERDLVLRLTSLLWRLRRATAVESGLFKIQAKHLLQFRQRRQVHQEQRKIINTLHRYAAANDKLQETQEDSNCAFDPGSLSTIKAADRSDDFTRAFVRLINLPTIPSTG